MKQYIFTLIFCIASTQAMHQQHSYDSLMCELRAAQQQLRSHAPPIKAYRNGFYSTCYEERVGYSLIYAPQGRQKINRAVLSQLIKDHTDTHTRILILESKLTTFKR